jgi:hypothetical protein
MSGKSPRRPRRIHLAACDCRMTHRGRARTEGMMRKVAFVKSVRIYDFVQPRKSDGRTRYCSLLSAEDDHGGQVLNI